MQISRTFLVSCAGAFCLALLPLCAADADADMKLREALEKKLNELQTQPPAPIPQPKKTIAPPTAKTPAAVPSAQPAPAPVIIAPPPTDSETIAKAREALRQKMNELQTQPGQAVPQPVVTAPPPVKTIPAVAVPAPAPRPTPPAQWTPPPAAQPLPPVAQPARVPTPVPAPAVQVAPKPVLVAPPPVDSETIAKTREALRQKMNELEAPPVTAAKPAPPTAPPAPAPTPVPAPTPAPPPQPQPVVVQPAPAPAPIIQPEPKPVLVAPTPVSPEIYAKAQAAMEQKIKELDAQPPIAPAQPPSMKPKANKGLPSFPPLKGPPPAVAADKEQRLQELLRKYRADQVTPEEYHQQRAKILAEP